MKELKLINPRNISDEEVSGYSLREAARAIVIDQDNLIGLLHVARDGYYKLPGGGVEKGEDKITALKRECLEEIGCDIEVLKEIGLTVEYWKEDKETQISYCYLAKVIGEKGKPKLDAGEIERGFTTVWLTYNDAIKVLKESKPIQFEGKYIVPRELTFLEEAKSFI